MIFDAVLKGDKDFWLEALADGPARSPLPLERRRPRVYAYEPGEVDLPLSGELADRLARLSGDSPALLCAALLAALGLCLHRYTGDARVVVGTPTSSELGVPGPADNLLPFTFEIGEGESFQALLLAVRRALIAACEHQRYPWQRLAEDLGTPVAENRSPLFDVALVLQGFHRPLPATCTADVLLRFRREGQAIAGTVAFNARLFHRVTLERFAGHFRNLLGAALAAPARAVQQLSILSAAETHQLLREWNRGRGFAERRCVHELVAEQAARRPEAVALVGEQGELRYGELVARAGRLARSLRRLGVGPEVVVGLCVERSPAMVVGALAILQAGGAYLPLDPSGPPERLAFLLADSGVAVVLTEARRLASLPAEASGRAVRRIPIDAVAEEAASPGEDECPAAGAAAPLADNLAYVIYTSGSTGRPKGSPISHRNVTRLLAATADLFGFGESDVWTLFHSLSFDFSVWELWGALASGGRLVVVPYWVSRSPEEFYRLLCNERVTVLNQTPAAFRQLARVEEGEQAGAAAGEPLALRLVLFGGEALDPASLAGWMARHGDERPRLFNLYGITETTVHATWRALSRDDVEGGGRSPIGAPLGDLSAHVLDRWGGLAPLGAAGELWVGGAGLARGYLGRPALTAERFAPDPFGAPGERLYRSGDLARRLPGGGLEYLGRLDDQVKVRGHRIEPGEVEAALAALPEVAEAAVLARGDDADSRRLVAYLVARPGVALPEAGELRRALARSLSEPMLPAAWVALAALPLTPHGKVDRRALAALPEPEAGRKEGGTPFAAPRTASEEQMAAIWAEVLGVERVGAQDDFFDLGGHSLLGARVLARVKQAWGLDLSLRRLFENPTVAGLARIIDAPGGAPAAAEPALAPRGAARGSRLAPERLPLSFAQQRLWFLAQLEPQSPAYNLPSALRLTGRLDVSALARSLEEIERRHEILRTVFVAESGIGTQVVRPHRPAGLPVVDLARLPPAAAALELRRLAAAEARRPFDLATGPPLRKTLVRLSAMAHVGLFTVHHIAADGWSLRVLVEELGALYGAFSRGRPSPLPELVLQYGDFAVWQRRWLAGAAADAVPGGVLEAQLAYWRRQLAGELPALDLPYDRPRTAALSQRGASEPWGLSGTLCAGLRELARRSGATLFMVLLAGFKLLLYRYTGQRDVLVGTAVANRPRPELERLIGLFLNTLVLRTELAGDPRFGELLARERETALAALAHQDVPFEKLVEELRPHRQLSSQPLFQVMFVLQNFPATALRLAEIEIEQVPAGDATARFDLTLAVSDAGPTLGGVLEYDADLFEAATIRRLLANLTALLAAIVEGPSRRLSELPALTAPERHALLGEWNDTAAPYRDGATVHQLFEEQAARTPALLALAFADRQHTYQELNQQANRLAHRLKALGVGPEVLVGVLLERSPAAVAAILATLKAGGAYLPLDPDSPRGRLARVLAEAGPAVLVSRRRLLGELAAGGARLVCLDEEESLLRTGRADDPASGATCEHLAYVIYTSGSTGGPKGVMVSHRGLCNLAALQARTFGLTAGDRVLQVFSFSFDASFWDLALALLSGAGLCVATEEARLPGSALVAWMSAQRVALATLPPSSLAVLPAAGLAHLRCVVATGEACSPEVVARWAAPGRRFFNGYGPTETTVGATLGECFADGRPPGLGPPFCNTRVYLLDDDLQPVPLGVPGEIYVGGVGLARGYRGRPDLTAERFVPNPFGAPGERLYRTGDLARFYPDRRLEFRGRLDDQLKVRGFRVEPAEVQAALASCPGVGEAAVVARRAGAGGGSLVAYVAPLGLDLAELRRSLRALLPDDMMPAAWVRLAALPRTASGKLDRAALPPPAAARPVVEDYVAPRNAAEERLAVIWEELLRVERVGVHDNFFALGGDSILSIQVVARARRAGLALSPRQVFEHQTVAELAAVAGESLTAAGAGGAATGPVPLTPVAHWFLERRLPAAHHWNQALLLALRQPVASHRLHRACARLYEHHDALRLRVAEEDAGWRQWCAAPDAAGAPFARLDLSALPPGKRAAALSAAASRLQASLDLAAGPLVRFVHIVLGEGMDERLLIIAHHLTVDGVSWRILLEDLSQLTAGEAAELPPRTTSLQRWAELLAERGASAGRNGELSYWLAVGAGAPPPLPRDRLAGENVERSARGIRVALDEEETRLLREEIQRTYHARIEEALLAAVAAACAAWTGESKLLVDVEGHGREELFEGVDLSRTVGWFTCFYPVLLEAPAGGPQAALLTAKERLRSVPARGVGYGLLRYLAGGEVAAGLAALPPAELSFNYLGQLDGVLAGASPFAPAPEDAGPPRHPAAPRSHALEVVAKIASGRLLIDWTYSRNLHRRGTVAALASRCAEALRGLLTHCRTAGAGAYTPSDFPQARLSQEDLDALVADLVEPEVDPA
jgi:amino acid adenylation domain-containing protein/non-ribosomal peptide synthase protein (TIGR01720 family)